MASAEFEPGELGGLPDSILLEATTQERLMLDVHGKVVYSEYVTTLKDKEALLLRYFSVDAADTNEHTPPCLSSPPCDGSTSCDPKHTAPVLLRLSAAARRAVDVDAEADMLSLSWQVSAIVSLLARHIHTSGLAALCLESSAGLRTPPRAATSRNSPPAPG
ncbi:hypothetical protein PsYK624_136790 [Phanerochaete sordida]|uniref:Uncharacterized protein n=1 Tax=Phanerochaete sordida TaxID=48140 RepID=A0A9P3GQ73_9APHY|nr:hypothetical protein PsYK624_136790 [Phanerochaete sordida]